MDKFPNEKFETAFPFFSGRLLEVLLPADSMHTDGFSSLYNDRFSVCSIHISYFDTLIQTVKKVNILVLNLVI